MKNSRFTEEQMVKILRELDSADAVDVAKKHGIATSTLYSWRRRFRGMQVEDVKEMRSLQAENSRLRKVISDMALENLVLKEVNAKKW